MSADGSHVFAAITKIIKEHKDVTSIDYDKFIHSVQEYNKQILNDETEATLIKQMELLLNSLKKQKECPNLNYAIGRLYDILALQYSDAQDNILIHFRSAIEYLKKALSQGVPDAINDLVETYHDLYDMKLDNTLKFKTEFLHVMKLGIENKYYETFDYLIKYYNDPGIEFDYEHELKYLETLTLPKLELEKYEACVNIIKKRQGEYEGMFLFMNNDKI